MDLNIQYMKNLPAGALFDLDGVLVDTESIYTHIWEDIERTYPTGIENFAIKIKGNTLANILNTYYPDAATSAKVCAMLDEREREMEYAIFDGVTAFLEDLREHHVPAAIVTSSNNAKMERLAKREPYFRSLFDAMVTDSCVSHSKPHPEPYMTGASMLGVAPERCIVFEDSFAGMQSGRASGAAVVALATTNPRESIVGKADTIIDGFGGLTLETLLELLSEGGRSF